MITLLLILLSQAHMPDLAKVPGATRPELTLETICATRWGKDQRHVSQKTKMEVLLRDGFAVSERSLVEIDHLIPRSLGGADVKSNLFAQPYQGEWNAYMKDRLEVRLSVLVCSGKLDLEVARTAIKTDWVSAYKTYVVIKKRSQK